MNVTKEEMKQMTVGSIVKIACPECEGHEAHKKLLSGKWICQWCGDVKDMNTRLNSNREEPLQIEFIDL
ncbi:hypothetical protein [Paenibacillus sp. EPM92]|uniref:hypothetical protein n=1 Tax=Paenibacillus sp. EPM92 TaxID=1561195 RepID=UPI0019162BD2|nr:hypothetical protein [Paenibacillus sp. EPM92]